MISKSFSQKPVEPFFMNSLPFSAREVGTLLFREYRLDQLVQMRLNKVDKDLDNQYKLSIEIWQLTLNYVILTKLSTFSIYPQLNRTYLTRLLEISAMALDEPSASATKLIQKIGNDAPILASWLTQLKTALPKAK